MQCFKVSFQKADRSEKEKKVRKIVTAFSFVAWGWLILSFCSLLFLYPFLILSNFRVLAFLSAVIFLALAAYIKFSKNRSNTVMLVFSGLAVAIMGLVIWGIWTTVSGTNLYSVELLEKLSDSFSEADLMLFVPYRYAILVKYFESYIKTIMLIDGCAIALLFVLTTVIAIVSGVASAKAKRLNNNLLRQHIIPFDDRISGVAFAQFINKESVPFKVYYDVIEEVSTGDKLEENLSAYELAELHNLFIKCNDGTEISLLVDEPEEAKNAILDAKQYYFPTNEKRVCSNCGWFMIGARCPHCKGMEYTVYQES